MTEPATSPAGSQVATKFTLYSDRSFLTPGASHVTALIPFWGPTPEDPDDPASGRYEAYAASGRRLFDLGSLEECDAAIFPEGWEHVVSVESAQERAAAFVAEASEAGKPSVIFFWSDSTEPVGLDATVFRTSLYRSRRQPREFAQPAWAEDPVERYLGGTLPLAKLKSRPVVGFCGYAPGRTEPPTTRELLRRRIADQKRRDRGRPRPTTGRRRRARSRARDPSAHPDVETNIVLRDAFWAGMTSSSQSQNVHRVRREYIENIVGQRLRPMCPRRRQLLVSAVRDALLRPHSRLHRYRLRASPRIVDRLEGVLRVARRVRPETDRGPRRGLPRVAHTGRVRRAPTCLPPALGDASLPARFLCPLSRTLRVGAPVPTSALSLSRRDSRVSFVAWPVRSKGLPPWAYGVRAGTRCRTERGSHPLTALEFGSGLGRARARY